MKNCTCENAGFVCTGSHTNQIYEEQAHWITMLQISMNTSPRHIWSIPSMPVTAREVFDFVGELNL